MKRRLVISVMLVLLACGLVGGQNQTATASLVELNVGRSKIKFPDLELLDQEGRKVRFYSDLIKDKVVVLSFFYTSCTFTCTMQGKTFARLQTLLGERLGKSVVLISVSTDPAKDKPGELKAWAKRYNVQPGWTVVTGEEREMSKLLLPFTGSPAGGEMHLPVTFIGNDKTGTWTSADGVFAAEDLLKVVDFLTR
ncbi:MAG TPA: SCO family protein [Pyrinomonadaceae bacterium]|nr:SCO family protein [Pyrinomonadaceae bacterium]